MKSKKKKTLGRMERAKLMNISRAFATGSESERAAAIDAALVDGAGPAWIANLEKLRAISEDGRPRFSIFVFKGNKKEPYPNYSELPIVTCPGAGECAKYCYSLKAWRYPAAFCRQAQNTLLARDGWGRLHIAEAFSAVVGKMRRRGKSMAFRLFVDGDFSSEGHAVFWLRTLREYPDVQAYGYTKSFREVMAAADRVGAPDNYLVNLSAGHSHSLDAAAEFARQPYVRGAFESVDVPGIKKTGEKARAAIAKAYKAQTGTSAFVCPGKCGDCVKTKDGNVHFCGWQDPRARDVPVVIARH